jgi:YegS/Rv2252/BmrU family lipid kinase
MKALPETVAVTDWLFWSDAITDMRVEVKECISKKKYDVVVAAGGDGTANLIAGTLIGLDIAMAIIPFGSGNGLARHLKIPLRWKNAVDCVLNGQVMVMDAAMMNENYFFCTAGVGFDAHIGHIFAQLKKRGPLSYVKSVIKEFRKYKPQKYQITVDGEEMEREAFLITVANAGQYGNNAWIAPRASISDGLLDVTLLSRFNTLQAPLLAHRLFHRSFDKSKKVEVFRGKNISILSQNSMPAHFDGEPASMPEKIVYSIIPSAVKIMVP